MNKRPLRTRVLQKIGEAVMTPLPDPVKRAQEHYAQSLRGSWMQSHWSPLKHRLKLVQKDFSIKRREPRSPALSRQR